MDSSHETFGRVEFVDSMAFVEFDTDQGVFQATYDSDRDSTSLAVVGMVATARNRDPLKLPPLHSSIDAGALDDFFSVSTNNGIEGCASISFRYEGFEVTVFSEGLIEADPMANT